MTEELNSSLLGELNARQNELRVAFRTGAEPEEYTARLHSAAIQVYELIKRACAAGVEVEAHKDNGRIHRFQAVGPMKTTRFNYARDPAADFEAQRGLFEDSCELGVIERFSFRPGLRVVKFDKD